MTQPIVDLTKFGNSVRDNLSGCVVGYAGIVGSTTDAPVKFTGGSAVTPANGQQQSYATSTRSALACVSKFLTGLAAVQLLDPAHPGTADAGQNHLGANLDTPIAQFGLPKDWKIRSDAQQITYRDVLTHRSGIAPAGSTGGDDARLRLASLELPQPGVDGAGHSAVGRRRRLVGVGRRGPSGA